MNVVIEPKKRKKPLYLQEIEARELGRLIEEDEIAEMEKNKLLNRILDAFQNINSNEKIILFLVILFLGILSIVVWLTFFDNAHESRFTQLNGSKGLVEKNTSGVKPIIFKLDSFFMPLLKGEKETGQFLTVEAELILSNKIVLREAEQALPLIRQNIFSILKRTKSKDFITRKKIIEGQIKKEIISTTNATLISGIGSVEDVFFSQFIVN
jgi:flagellar basal body-associated protein FliL